MVADGEGSSLLKESFILLPASEDESASVWKLRAAVAVADSDKTKQRGEKVLELSGPHERIYGDA